MAGVLIDTSVWIEAMRRGGDEALRRSLGALVTDGRARFSDWVRLELWAGGESKRRWLRQMQALVETAPTTALRTNGLDLFHRDAHLKKIVDLADKMKT